MIILHRIFKPLMTCALLTLSSAALSADSLPDTIDIGETGFDVKRPTLASACPHGCPWGEVGDFVESAMEPLGYDVVQCRNCNRDRAPRLISTGQSAPALDHNDYDHGTDFRFDNKIDFGITGSDFLTKAYLGKGPYANSGPHKNLRLIAKLEDPTYLLVAAKKELSISNLSEIKKKKLGLKILAADMTMPVLEYYGLNKDLIESYGGEIIFSMGAGVETDFDIIIDEMGSSAKNPESSQWTTLSENYELEFLQLPDALLDYLVENSVNELHRVNVKWGYLRGIDRPIRTVARSGTSVFIREDAPNQAAYDIAKAIDLARDQLKWYIRIYGYDPRTVWKNNTVPLHPGAEKYYREVGYIK